MADGIDFVAMLEFDVVFSILMLLNPLDLLHVCSVSRLWHQFVINNGILKRKSQIFFPELTTVGFLNTLDAESSNNTDWEILRREHKAYSFFLFYSRFGSDRDCIKTAVCSSSTNNSDETIEHTVRGKSPIHLYWSSFGQVHSDVPERLTYKLRSDLCLVYGFCVAPYHPWSWNENEQGPPLYMSTFVRIRLGHPKVLTTSKDDFKNLQLGSSIEDKISWTYTSPKFPMAQAPRSQAFLLPDPILSIGGFVQVELLGRVNKQEQDDLYYIRVSRVQVVGKSFGPVLNMKVTNGCEKYLLDYSEKAQCRYYFPCGLRLCKSCSASAVKMSENLAATENKSKFCLV